MPAILTKKDIERMTDAARMSQAGRKRVGKYDVLIADGFIAPHRIANDLQKFEVDPNDHPFGCFATIWWAMKDERLGGGGHIICDAFHDSGADQEERKRLRVKAAIAHAEASLSGNTARMRKLQ